MNEEFYKRIHAIICLGNVSKINFFDDNGLMTAIIKYNDREIKIIQECEDKEFLDEINISKANLKKFKNIINK